MCRQFLIQRIFYHDMPVLDFSFPFHSFPVLSFVLSREQAQQMSTHLPLASFAASIGKGYPFLKNPRFYAMRQAGIFSCWEFPKPFAYSSVTTTMATPRLGNSCPHFLSRPKSGFCCTLPLTIYNTQKSKNAKYKDNKNVARPKGLQHIFYSITLRVSLQKRT